MRVDLTEIIERGEGAFLVFPMRTRVHYTWHVAGRAHLRRREQGYLVPVADSIVREQLKNIHVGCEVTPETGGMSEVDADELDNVLRLAGMPFMVDRGPALRESTENAVWVRFPGEDEIPIQFSRYRKWQAFWGKRAVLLWWQCESEQEWQRRIEDEWRASGGRMTLPQTTAFLPESEDDADDDEPLEASNHHHEYASPGIFKVFVVFEHPDGRALGAAVVDMRKDLMADLVVFDGVTPDGSTRYDGVAYSERKEGEAPTPGTWHY